MEHPPYRQVPQRRQFNWILVLVVIPAGAAFWHTIYLGLGRWTGLW